MVGSGKVSQVWIGMGRFGLVRYDKVTQVFRTGGTGMCKHMEVFSLLGLKAHYI